MFEDRAFPGATDCIYYFDDVESRRDGDRARLEPECGTQSLPAIRCAAQDGARLSNEAACAGPKNARRAIVGASGECMQRRVVQVLAVVCAFRAIAPVLGVAQVQNVQFDWRPYSPPGDLQIPVATSYQRVLANHFALFVAPSALSFGLPGDPYRLMLDQDIEIDWHPFNRGLGGLFIGALFRFSYYFDEVPSAFSVGKAAGCVAIGFQLTLVNSLLLRLSLLYTPAEILLGYSL